MAAILLIDDDPEFSRFLQQELANQGHQVDWFDLADDALKVVGKRKRFDLVLLDNKMPRMSGIEFLVALKEKSTAAPVILITSEHNDQTVYDALNNGATDYIVKPDYFEEVLEELQPAIEEALKILPPHPVHIADTAGELSKDDSTIVGRSKAIVEVLKDIWRVSELDETVLVLGETGTGKDLVARAVHTNSRRKDKSFVVMNCSAFNENLLDDELFGHEPGAFTGAAKLRKGRFEHAHGGTLFLDEVGDMPMTLQAKLLRVLENHEVVRIGSNEPIKVDVRVVAATHRDLKSLVDGGQFRQDLFYRLEGMTILLPPLRERKEDIELLANRFLNRLLDGGGARPIHPKAMDRLRNYHWPGNVRQLQKVLCRAVARCRGPQIMPEDLEFGEFAAPPGEVEGKCEESVQGLLRRAAATAWENGGSDLLSWLKEQLERELLALAVNENKSLGLSQDQLAGRLGMARGTLWKRVKEYGLSGPTSSVQE